MKPFLALACAAASAAALATADQCSAVSNPAPCGQAVDTEATCVAKGCCYNGKNSKIPCFYPSYDAVNITQVYVIQACHFDAGFANSTVGILNLWFDHHFPLALEIGEALDAQRAADEVFSKHSSSLPSLTPGPALKFMAQSWIVSLYTDCPKYAGLNCPSPAALANFTKAVSKGYITWHAFPFNSELELCDASMLGFGVNITNELDDAFGVRRKSVLSQRDVPGLSRASLSTLQQNGVRAITVGVNGASTPPSVPRAFIWRDAASNVSMPSMWHPGGYGGITYEDAIIVPGLPIALVPDWRGDNAGPPPSTQDVINDWKAIAGVFPGAEIIAVTWDDWVDQLLTVTDKLPVLETEVAETWIHGAPSDPHKQIWFKRWQQLRTDCLDSGACDINDYAFRNFSRFALKASEHTDGMDVKTFLHDTVNWSNTLFQAAINQSNFQTIIASWVEQRAYAFDYALGALPTDHPLYAPLQEAIGLAYPPSSMPNPNAAGWIPQIPGTVFTAGRYELAFDAQTGALSHLLDSVTGQTWANGASNELLGYLEYHTYDQTVYDAFLTNYSYVQPLPSWFFLDFSKPNVSLASPVHQELPQTLGGVWQMSDTDAVHFIVQGLFIDANGTNNPHTNYGAAAVAWTLIDIPLSTDANSNNVINVTVQLYEKTPTRLPEALFFRFNATSAFGSSNAPAAGQWYTTKYGELVDPYDVQLRGNQKHHGVHAGGIVYTKADPSGNSPNATLTITAPNTPIINFGHPFGLPTPTTIEADPSEGASFLLHDNTWGTNYVMWTPFLAGDENIQWHFSLNF